MPHILHAYDTTHPQYTLRIHDNWLSTPKAQHIAPALRATAPSHLTPLTLSHDITLYTDGSVDPITGAAGVAFISEGASNKWRVSNGASSFQTELVAIRGALEHGSSHQPVSPLIATDSKSALQALKNSSPTENRHLLTHIHSILHTLQEEGIHLSFIWIPSHIGIHGNEKADTIAKEAARRPTIDVELPKNPSIIKQQT